MTEEKQKRIQANIERTNARAEGRLSGANTNRDRASQNLGNYFAGTYIPQKANAYTQGVTDFNQRYSDYLGRTQSQKQYQSPDTFARLEQQRQNAYENPNKQYAQMYARMQLEQGNNAPYQMMYGLNEAGEKQKQSISGLSDYYSQFGSQEGYNNAMEQQRLLSYDVEDAKRRLEQLKANQPESYGFHYEYSQIDRGNNDYPIGYNEWEQQIEALESEIAKAEQTKQFYEDMKDPVKRAEYESYMQEQKSLEYRYSQMNPIEKIGHQLGQGFTNLAAQFMSSVAASNEVALKASANSYKNFMPGTDMQNAIESAKASREFFSNYADYVGRYSEYYKNGLTADLYGWTGDVGAAETISNALTIGRDAVMQAIPSIVLAMATGGASAGATAVAGATKGASVGAKALAIAKNLANNIIGNPLSFGYSFMMEGGSAYNQVKAEGGDDLEAAIAMFLTGMPNAVIEVGGGIETLPKDKSAKGIRNWLKTIAKSGTEEGLEEIKQGIVSELVSQAMDGKIDIATLLDPSRMVQEFYGGFVGGTSGSAIQQSIAKRVGDNGKIRLMVNGGYLENIGKTIIPYTDNSEIKSLYEEVNSKVAKGEKVSRKTYLKLWDLAADVDNNIVDSSISQNLAKLGVSNESVNEAASVVKSLYDGNPLTIDQAEIIANNDKLIEIFDTHGMSAASLVEASQEDSTMQDIAMLMALPIGTVPDSENRMRISEIDNRVKKAIDMIGLKNTTSAMGIKGIAPMAIERNGVTEEISIADSSAGRVLVRTPSGETFDAENAPFATPETQTLVQLAGDYNTDTANVFVNSYPAQMDIGEYASLFADVYNLAKTSKYSLQELNRLYAPLTSHPSVIRDAYNAAIHEIAESRRAYEEKQKSRRANQKRSKGKLKISKEAQELVKKEHKSFADFIAKATKYTVRITFDEKAIAQGRFDSTETEIVVNLAKGDFFSTMLHEVTHFIELNNVEGYNAFANEVMRYLSTKGILKETFDRYAVAYSSEIESIDELSSEVVANAAESLMKSEDFLKELFTDKDFIQHIEGTKAQRFVEKVIAKLNEILDSIKQFMADATLNHTVAEVFAEDTEQLNRMVKLWTDAFKGAAMSEDVSADTDTDTETVTAYGESEDVGIPTTHQAEVQTSVKNSVAEYRDDNYKFIMPLGTSAPKLFTVKQKNGIEKKTFTGKEIIEIVGKKNKLSDSAISDITTKLDSIATFMEEADVRFTAIGLADLNNAKAKVRTVKDSKGTEIAEVYISAMVNNGDYPVNFDMTTVCKRREAAARVIKAIALKEGQKSSDGDTYNVDLSPQDLFRINEVLSAEGFETACLGCFVESKRYNMQNWAESFIGKWNSIVAKYVKNADYFEFATQDTIDLANINTRAVDTAYNSSAEAMKLTKPETDSMYSYEIEEDGRMETVEVDLLNEAIPDELWAKIEIAAGSEAKENGYVHIGKDRMRSLTQKHESGESLSADDIKFLKGKKVVPGTQLSNAEKIEAFIEANPDLRKKLRISDLLTTDGIESIKRLSPALLGILSGHYGTATPKMMQGYTTYNSEIALLSDKKGKKSMTEYLKSVAGIRMNSFSDFKIETLLDYMQIIADMHIRGFTSHAYTKEIAFAEIFGKTGVKINVSIMFNVMNEAYWKQFPKVYQEAGFKSPEEAAKGLAGLYVNENGELDFLVADKSTRTKVNNLIESTLGLTETDENGNVKEASWKPQQFVQSAEFEQAVELMHREGYSSNVGTIGVGYSKLHIIMMLNDSRFRYVIPYHSSSLPSVVKVASRLKLATDFTSVQNTLELSSVVENGEKITFSKESTDGYKWMTDKITSFVEQGMSYAQAYQKLSDMMDSGEITLKFRKYQKAKNQHGTFDTYADLEATNDPKATCDNYLKYCADNGLMPMFYEFVGNENYYKLNFDFNVYDNNSGEYAPQNPVGFAFPDNLEAIAEGYMEEANRTYEALDTKMSGILDRLDAESKAKAESKNKTDTYSMLADAKFSLPETDTASYDILARDNVRLQNQVKHLENEMKLTEGHKMKPEAVSKLARKLKKDYYSTLSAEEISAELTKIFEYIANTENASGDIAMRAMHSLAKRIVDSSQKLDTTLADEYKSVTDLIKKTKIRVTPAQKDQLIYLYGSYSNFRKSNLGRMPLSLESGTPVDSLWQELSEIAPNLFETEAFPDTEMLPRISDVLDILAPEYVNPYGQDADTFISGLASEIFDSYFDMPEVKTFADKQKAKLDKEIYNGRKRRAEQRARDKAKFEERLEKLKAESKEKLNAVKADNKRKTAEKLLKQQAKYQDMAKRKIEKQREAAEKSKLRHRIEKNSKTMMKWLNENSDKHHVPEVLRETTATFLSALDFVSFQQRANERKGKVSQSTTSWNEALRRLKDIISDYIPNDNGETKAPDFELDIDPDFMDRLSEFIRLQTMPVKPIPEMNSEQLREIDYIVTVLKSAITTANSFYLNRMAQNVAEIGDATISQLQAKKSKRLNNNAVDKLLNMHMLDSGSFFRELGPAAESIYAEIREGFNKRVRCIEQAQKYMQELLKDVDVSDWTGDKATVHTFKINGEELKMTTAQMMSLYELWKRKQAQEHITKGGIVPTEIKLGKKLLNKVFGAVEPVRLSETDLVRIFSELTPQQREIADKMQKFLSENCSDWGNEVSMAMYGYRKFTEPDYFPIKSSDNEVKSSDGNTSQSGLYKIKNQGMTKATVKGANNAIQVDDIFNTFTTHVVEMADYNAYAMPLSDAMKWYNYKVRDGAGRMHTIKGEMERTYGSQAKAYFIQLIKDINGDAGNATASEISTALLGKMKAASVAGNVRVALQQPTSIARAMVLMDPQYIGLGVTNMLKNPNKAIKEAQEHSSIAQWKSWGYFDTGLGKSLKEVITGQTPLRDKIVEKTMILAAYGDKVTWGALWEACKLEVAKNISPDSNGYMGAVTKRFDEIIDKTQVVDTVLHRSQIMRSKDTAVKMATSFMSEPTKTYNLMRNAITDMYHNRTKESVTNFARTTSAVMFTAVLTAAAAALSDAFRDDDKSKDWGEKYIDNFFENIVDNANPLNMIPYFKDIVSAVQGYDVERSDVAALVGFGQFVMQLFGKVEDGKEINFFNTVYDMSRYVSQFTGIPIFNLLREADSVIDIFADPLFRKDKTKAADVYVKLYDALISDNDAETDKMYQKLIEDGKDLQAIESGLRTQLLNPESEIYEERIVEAAKARLDGNTAEYMRLMKEIIADTGLSQDFWVKTVNTQINRIRNDGKELSEDKEFLIKNGLSADMVDGMTEQQIKETVKQYQTSSYKDLTAGDSMSLYDMNDLATAVTKGDTESFKEVYQDILEAKVDELLQKDNSLTMKKAEEKAKSSIKSSITSKIKPIAKDLYKTNKDKFAKLRTFLIKHLGYDSKTVNNWTYE